MSASRTLTDGTRDDHEPHYRSLLDRLRARDESAVRELHARLGRRIVAFAMHRLQDADMAQTVMIDTLHEVWRHPDRFRGESRFETWVLGIARYKLLSLLRARPRETDDIADYEDRLVDAAPGPAERHEARDRGALVQRCLEAISAVQRECLHLFFYEGLGIEELAAVQGVPGGTVKTRLFHGRRNMRDCLARHGLGGDDD